MNSGKINYSPDYKSDADKRDEVEAAAIASYYPSVQGSEKIALEEDIVEALRAARAEFAGVSSLEREVVEAAKKWNNTNHRNEESCEARLTELGDAVDVLEAFEQKQK